MERLRLSGKEMYVFYPKGMGNGMDVEAICCTNKTILSKRSGVGYDNLVRVFTRERKSYYENEEVIIIRVYIRNVVKGRQSISRRGKGGMEAFKRYLSGKRSSSEY